MIQSVIIGSGSYLPERKIGKDFFLDRVFFDESGQKIPKDNKEIIDKFTEITEIKERRYINDDLVNSDMAKVACEKAIKAANIDKEEIDYIIAAHNYGDITLDTRQINLTPSFSIRLKHKLGIKTNKCKAYDMLYGCPGWVEASILADQLIKSKTAKNILVVGSDTLSRAVDPHDRNSMIFADGSGAILYQAKETQEKIGIINHLSICDSNEEIEYIINGPSLNPDYKGSKVNIQMKGRKVYEYALKTVPSAMKSVLDESGFNISDLKMILLHQANAKMDKAIIQRFFKLYGISEVPAFVEPMTVQTLGNTSVATVPVLFDLVKNNQIENHSFNKNDVIIFASVGAGMIVNAFVYKF